MNDDALVTVEVAAVAAYVRPRTIRAWKDRGHLAVAGYDRRGRMLFRLGDVLDVEAATRRNGGNRPLLALAVVDHVP